MISLPLPEDPNTPQFSVEIADTTKMRCIRTILEQMHGKPFVDDTTFRTAFSEASVELNNNQEFWAKVEAEGLRYTAQLGEAMDRSIEFQAAQAASSDRWQFHPGRPGNVIQYLQEALQETEYGSGKFYRVRWIAGAFVPWCLAHGLDAVEHIWDRNVRAKAQYMAERLMGEFRDQGIYVEKGQEQISPEQAQTPIPDETQQKMEQMMAAVTNPEVSVSQMREQFPVTQSKIPPMNTYKFTLDSSDLYVTVCLGRQQSALFERLLGGKMALLLGTGNESFIRELRGESFETRG